jgi:hypothetical protein
MRELTTIRDGSIGGANEGAGESGRRAETVQTLVSLKGRYMLHWGIITEMK